MLRILLAFLLVLPAPPCCCREGNSSGATGATQVAPKHAPPCCGAQPGTEGAPRDASHGPCGRRGCRCEHERSAFLKHSDGGGASASPAASPTADEAPAPSAFAAPTLHARRIARPLPEVVPRSRTLFAQHCLLTI